MQTYDYKCETCGETKEFVLPMKHSVPKCDKKKCDSKKELTRIYSPPAIQFKGGGWTETSQQTKEKNKKLKKLWDDSYVGD